MPGFGNSLRAAGTAFVVAPLSAIFARIMGELLPLIGAPQNSLLYTAFNTINENAIIFGLLSAIMLLVARAIVPSPRRGVR